MLYAPGTMFVMSHRGHLYFNVATGKVDEASCVMVRAVLLSKELLDGPGRVSKRLQMVEALDGKMLGVGLDVLANDLQPPMVIRDTSATDRAKNSTARHRADQRWIGYQQSLV
jgi:3-methyladenine DNA glycosylase Mpg